MQRIHMLGLLVILLILAGCTGQDAPQGSDTDSDNTTEAVTVPEPSSDEVGTVSGTILNSPDADTGPRPLNQMALYLGEILESDTGVEALAGLSKSTAPQTMLGEQGNFAFVDVPPGRYTLWLDSPGGAIVLNQPAGGNMIIEVAGGEMVELGELVYALEGL
ncbi:MAG: hypothetical protein AAGF95_13710 [Chloroflexota bacterium]